MRLPAGPAADHVDAALMAQVLANLLENAVRYTPPGTRHDLRPVRDGRPRVAVEDDGAGLPPGDPERLFDKFQRGREEGEVAGPASDWRSAARSSQATAARSSPNRPQGGGPVRVHAADRDSVTEAMYRVLVVEDDP